MQILNVKAENFKGLKLVEVAPKEGTTVIGGKNRAGKSSFLDAIAAVLGGAKLCPKKPIRDGQDKAECSVKLAGDMSLLFPACTITRTWERRENGSIKSQLQIVTAEGNKAPTPQTIMNDLVGPLGFDPERFLRMDPKEQAEILRGLVGLDFTELDAEREKAYASRTEVNRNGKTLKAKFDGMPIHADAPEEEVSVADLMTELQRRQAVNRRNEEVRGELADIRVRVLPMLDDTIHGAELDVTELEAKLNRAIERLEDLAKKKATATGDGNVKAIEVNSLKDEDEAEVQDQVAASEDTNRKVRENSERARLDGDMKAERERSAKLSEQINQIDAQKQKLRQDAEWPVESLGYDENGVTLMDRPFE